MISYTSKPLNIYNFIRCLTEKFNITNKLSVFSFNATGMIRKNKKNG